jgi:hypothetical protein
MNHLQRVLRVYSPQLVHTINSLLDNQRENQHLTKILDSHEENLSDFCPARPRDINIEKVWKLDMLRDEMHNLLEEIVLQHRKTVGDQGLFERMFTRIEGLFGEGFKADENLILKAIENANQMVSAWEAADVLPQKKFSILFDYLFIVGYAGSIFLILKESFDKTGKIWVKILMYLPILAGILDAIENFGLWQIVSHNGNQFYASLAFYSASIKFLLLIPSVLGVMYFVSLKFLKKI